ncbi:MAG: radical SAM protein [Rhodopirellula sp.]|nr:radical SAM protein [Rhodopirellula sp.]
MSIQLATTERVALAKRHYYECCLCEHRCRVRRTAERQGRCRAAAEAHVYRHRIEWGEELELIPSHLFYLSGCDLRCDFCIGGADAFDASRGRTLSGVWLAEAVNWGTRHGARNIQWVGGEPTIHLPAILEAMAACEDLPPVVWKSNFHGTPAAFDLLDGIVDVYVADFKFGNNGCARRLAGIQQYVEIVTRNLAIAAGQADLIVRHLLMPGHDECCFRPVVQWMAEHLPATKFSIRDGFLPRWRAARHAELARPLPIDRSDWARHLALEHGLRLVR